MLQHQRELVLLVQQVPELAASTGGEKWKPWPSVAALAPQHQHLLGVLDALGDGLELQGLAEPDDGADQRGVVARAARAAR